MECSKEMRIRKEVEDAEFHTCVNNWNAIFEKVVGSNNNNN
jgi:hypothetical protein